MKVSYQWLSQYVDIHDIDPYELANRLTNSGVAVDIVEKRDKGIEKIVIGYVTESGKHPNAEKLSLCKVNVGNNESLQIVCGAANVAKGQKVPVALVGAILPNDVKIKRAKLRGIESEGMICSAKELGLNEKLLPKGKTDGILVLPDDAVTGERLEPLLGLDDYILELDLTPNRSDCLSMIGVAYEVAAILGREVHLPENKLGTRISDDSKVKVEIEAKEACPHYASKLMTGVKIDESPQWLQNYLIAAGIRPINNVVDITNYVLMEYGQPLHAFDFERFDQPNILVRLAKQNEKVITLDDQERELDDQMMLITDGVKPVAIAGVMGLANSEVTEDTTTILLESAYFNGASIRRTSKKLGLRSEASLRFEKGVDPNRIHAALNRASQMLVEIAGARLEGDIYEHRIEEYEEKKITIQPEQVNQLLGTEIDKDEMISIFKRLGFTVTVSEGSLLVDVPTRRQDISIVADLVEEIARLYGYDNIPTTLPGGVYIQGGLTDMQLLRRNIRNLLESSGLQEVITYTFTNSRLQRIVQGLADEIKPISLAMPLSEDKQILRTTLVPNLLEAAKYNINRRIPDVSIYEMGAAFITKEDFLSKLPEEKLIIAGLLTGSLPKYWKGGNQLIDFYYVKGILEDLFNNLGLTEVKFSAASLEGYHPGRAAKLLINNDLVGYIGQLHPKVQQQYDLNEAFIFELDLGGMIENADTEIDYLPLPKYPAIQRDIAIVVEKELEVKDLINTIEESAKELLESLTLFDVYTGEQLGKDKKSIAFSLTFRSREKTLTDEEVSHLSDQILSVLKEKYQAELRK